MTPLFACFPVCIFFVGLAIIGLIVIIFDVANRIPGDDQKPRPEDVVPTTGEKTGPPPWWVIVLLFVGAALIFMGIWLIGGG
jgi:hypothetical protein